MSNSARRHRKSKKKRRSNDDNQTAKQIPASAANMTDNNPCADISGKTLEESLQCGQKRKRISDHTDAPKQPKVERRDESPIVWNDNPCGIWTCELGEFAPKVDWDRTLDMALEEPPSKHITTATYNFAGEEDGIRHYRRVRGASTSSPLPSSENDTADALPISKNEPEDATPPVDESSQPWDETLLRQIDYSLIDDVALLYREHCVLEQQFSCAEIKTLVRRMHSADLKAVFEAVDYFNRKDPRDVRCHGEKLVTKSEIRSLWKWYREDGSQVDKRFLRKNLRLPRELLDQILAEAKDRRKMKKRIKKETIRNTRMNRIVQLEHHDELSSPEKEILTESVEDVKKEPVDRPRHESPSRVKTEGLTSTGPTIMPTRGKRRRKEPKKDVVLNQTACSPAEEANQSLKMTPETPTNTRIRNITAGAIDATPEDSMEELPTLISDKSGGLENDPGSYLPSPKTPRTGERLRTTLTKRSANNITGVDVRDDKEHTGLDNFGSSPFPVYTVCPDARSRKLSVDPHEEHLLNFLKEDFKTMRTREERAICAGLRMALGDMEYALQIESGELAERVKEKKKKHRETDKLKAEQRQLVDESNAVPMQPELDGEESEEPFYALDPQKQSCEESEDEDIQPDEETTTAALKMPVKAKASPSGPVSSTRKKKSTSKRKSTTERDVDAADYSSEHQEDVRSSKAPRPQKGPTKSPYFPTTASTKPKTKKPAAVNSGDTSSESVSCLPVPNIDAKTFGLIQEQTFKEPFHLLLACMLLNKTNATQALPTLFKLIGRYPTPDDLAEADVGDIFDIIEHLGFGVQRACRALTFALIWRGLPQGTSSDDKPKLQGKATRLGAPRRGCRYRTLNYPVIGAGRDVGVNEVVGDEEGMVCASASASQHRPRRFSDSEFTAINSQDATTQGRTSKSASGRIDPDPRCGAFEIAYLPGSGRYALDSWRIFCRDICRGVATDYDGGRAHKKAIWLPVDDASDDSSQVGEGNDKKERMKIVRPGEPEWSACCRGIIPESPSGAPLTTRQKSYLPADLDIVVPPPKTKGKGSEKQSPDDQPTDQPIERPVAAPSTSNDASNDAPPQSFQPEWQRVLPHDKELRAFLCWMWRRDGWEWNPYTGEKTRIVNL